MSLTPVIVPTSCKEFESDRGIVDDLNILIYLPKEGLQGENIPSHILWMNAKSKNARIIFSSPLKCKEVFNAEKYVIKNNEIIIEKIETEGYIGLVFETFKVNELETNVPINYSVTMTDGRVINETKEIKLFKPKLEIQMPKNNRINIEPKTGYVKGRIKIRNIGRGSLIIKIKTSESSATELYSPPEYREFAEKFNSDLDKELEKLSEEIPHFKPIYEEIVEWEKKDYENDFEKQSEGFLEFINRLSTTLANDKELLQGFVESYTKAAIKNSEYIEALTRVVKIFQSFVSYDIFLTNPLDQINVDGTDNEVFLEIAQTDKIFSEYDDIILPPVLISASEPVSTQIYRIFDWGD